MQPLPVDEVRPRKDHCSVDLISDALQFGWLWYGDGKRNRLREVSQSSHVAVIRVYDEACNAIETHEHTGEFKEP